MSDALLQVDAIHTFIGQFHILEGVSRSACRRAASPCCWGATARARRRRCAASSA
ncbi:MAG: hypothetical protein U0521_03100 [Anaerolineae bacterium]